MNNTTLLEDEISKCFESMKKLIDDSFLKLQMTPSEKDKLVDFWKVQITEFKYYIFKASERNNNKDIFKAITKALVFGK